MIAVLLIGVTIGLWQAQPTIVVSPRTPIHSIAAAIRLAQPGTVIRVKPGVYREPMIVVDKRLDIVGDSWPVLDGDGRHQIMAVTGDDVTVRGLVFRNVGASYVEDRAALKVIKARRCTIADNRLENAFFGIYLAAVTDCRLTGNVITGIGATDGASGNGIHLWSSNRITIEGNHISGHRDGIYFEFVHDSDVRGNTSERNFRYGLHFMYSDDCRYIENVFRENGAGVAVMYTKRVTMRGNHFESNWGSASYGLLLKEVYDVQLERNRFRRNTVGLVADGANRLRATRNDFENNGWALKLMASTDDAHFTRNNFLGNSFDVASNSRESSNEFLGNYWDAYRGFDLNHDGVGDVPFHPVRLFSLLVQSNESSLVLMRSMFVGLLDAAERMLPTLTPKALLDRAPAMRRIQ
ncbi:MAG: nitrous oxide reductase family maturation protein NosD [Gemmatimonadaceae bacterium]